MRTRWITTREAILPRLAVAAAASSVAALVVLATHGAVVAQAPQGDIFLPLVADQFVRPFEPLRTAGPPPSITPATSSTAVAPRPSATRTPGVTASATQGARHTPTLPGGEVAHPEGAGTIILQVGFTQTDQIGEAWEEMNGTPWLTLYGDGTLIAGHGIMEPEQTLFLARVDEYFVQLWLRRLTYEIMFFTLRDDYRHPRDTKPSMHMYVETNGGTKRARLAGFTNWERHDVPAEPDRVRVRQLAQLVRDLESFATDNLKVPYQPERYTILAQEIVPILPDVPKWEGGVPVRAIASAAPTAASNYVNKRVGHRFVDADVGREVQAIVRPHRDAQFPFYTVVAEFEAGSPKWHYSVGARQEVPGGSLFLPDEERREFYRRDPGSGSPPLLAALGEALRPRVAERRHELAPALERWILRSARE